MKKILILIIFSLIILAACAKIRPYACTKDAKICPDGTIVGRVGPECEFDTCPGQYR